jgi:hypothetical protein
MFACRKRKKKGFRFSVTDHAEKACEQAELQASDSSSQNSSEVFSTQIVSMLNAQNFIKMK